MEGLSCYSPPANCDRTGLTLPVLEYTRELGISITGGYVYRGKAAPLLNGTYIYGDFGSGRLWGWTPRATGGGDKLDLGATGVQISTFGEDEAGELYLASYATGVIYRFAGPAGPLSVVDAATFGDGVVPGSIASVFGSGIAPVFGVLPATAFPLPRETAGVSVRVNGVAAPLLALASVNGLDQINFQVPFETPPNTDVVVEVTGLASAASAQVRTTVAQPQIFTVTELPGAWVIWATGLGAVSDQPPTGDPAPAVPLSRTLAETLVTVGGEPATVLYSGLAPGTAGLYQVNIVPPTQASPGAEVVLQVGGAGSKPWRR
jgi:hypothetical protein